MRASVLSIVIMTLAANTAGAEPARPTVPGAANPLRGKITGAKLEWGLGVGGSGQATLTIQGAGAPCRGHFTITHAPSGASFTGDFVGEAFPITRGVQPSIMGMTTVGFKPGDYTVTISANAKDQLAPDYCMGSASVVAKGRIGELQKISFNAATMPAGTPARLFVQKTYAACSFHLVLKKKGTNKEVTYPKNMETSDTIVQQYFGATDPYSEGEYTATVLALDTDKAKGDACVGSATTSFTVVPAPTPISASIIGKIGPATPVGGTPIAATYSATSMDVFYNPTVGYKAGQPVVLHVSVTGGQNVKGCYGAVRNAPIGSGIDVDIPHPFQISTTWNAGLKKSVGNASIDLSQDAFGSASKPGTYGWTLVRNVTSPFPDYPPCQFDTSLPLVTNGSYTVKP